MLDAMPYRYNTYEDPHGTLPDAKAECKWGAAKPNPHRHHELKPRPAICNSILDVAGHTPLVRLNKIPLEEKLECEMLVKCEYFNPGGSVKDRIAIRMIEEAERDGVLKPGSTIIEPTSGNTGIGLAMAAAVKGYKCIIVLPEKMSKEKVDVLHGFGAQIVRTPTSAGYKDPHSHIGVALRMCREIPGAVVLDQYRNPYNPIAHYDGTAEEIIKDCNGKVDMVVIGAGTGGTVTGIAKKIKDKLPTCKVVAIDPHGSNLADHVIPTDEDVKFYEVEGIGYDFIPSILTLSAVDEWVRTRDDESFKMARRLIRSEGLLVGGSSGTAVVAAVQAARKLKKGQRCVVILPDGIRNYMTKFLSDEWTTERDFKEREFSEPSTKPSWYNKPVSALPVKFVPKVLPDGSTFADALKVLKEESSYHCVLLDDKRYQSSYGSVDKTDILKALTSVEGVKKKIEGPARLPILFKNETLGHLHDILLQAPACVLVDDARKPVSIVDSSILLSFVASQ